MQVCILAEVRAKHFVNREVAAFGQPDSPEVCERVVASIPGQVLKNATRILDPAIGCCGIARAVVKRMVDELDIPYYDAILRVYGVDTDLALVRKARRLGFVNTVHADFLEWDSQMQFDVIIGNPPYSDMGKHNGSGGGGSSKNLDSLFFEKSVGTGAYVSFVMRSKHFVKKDSVFRRKLFSSGKVVSISYVPKEFFPTIKNTETCIVTWSDNHSGPTKITYKSGEVVERVLTSSTVIKLNNPNFVSEIDDNLVHRYLNGKLIRRKFEPGDCPIVEICGTGETPVIKYIKEGLEDTARNCWGVVINYSTAWGSLGRVMLKPYEASVSHSVICLKTDTEEEAVVLRDYLLSDGVKRMVVDNMPSFHPTKEMFRKIPDPFKA
jgi:methylase of polypeptide subunit release factors